MRKIALVQNQSEMAHYAYADCRSVFREFGYQIELFTAQNIDTLPQALGLSRFDALVLGSNALNDQTIRAAVYQDDFAARLAQHLEAGNGLLILLQLRIAQQFEKEGSKGILSFLPARSNVSLRPRPKEEKAIEGQITEIQRRQRHTCLVYPNDINLPGVQRRAVDGPSLRGLYWHYLDNVNEAEWDRVLVDTAHGDERILLAVAKETEPSRIAICTLPLDWQRHTELLANLSLYVTEGSHRTAVLGGHDLKSDPSFAYLLETLRATRFPFRHYTNEEAAELSRGIKNGAHSVLLVAEDQQVDRLSEDLQREISAAFQAGHLNVVGVEKKDDLRQIFFSGKENDARRQLESLLIRYSEDLGKGYIDGSFFSTIESLQIIERCSIQNTEQLLGAPSLGKILKVIEDHDREGSYDEVFHPTCALLWLRSKFFGQKDAQTDKTAQWVRQKLPTHQPREQMVGLYSLLIAGLASETETSNLRSLLESQLESKNQSELDLIFFLEVAVELNESRKSAALIGALLRIQAEVSGEWVDLSTTATAAYWILRARALPGFQKSANDLPGIYKALSYIQLSRSTDPASRSYGWDKKAVTSLRCLAALTLFEGSLHHPINQLVAMLASVTSAMSARRTTAEALEVVQRLKESHATLARQLFEVNAARIASDRAAKDSEQDLKAKNDQLTKENAATKKSLERLSFRTHLEIAVFWLALPILLAGAIGSFLALLSAAGNLALPNFNAADFAWSAVTSWGKAWQIVGYPLGAVLAVMGYFAKRRLSGGKKDSE